MPENTVAEVQAKEAAYEKLHGQRDWNNLTTACDLWTWAFFAPLIRAAQQLVPTSGTVRQMIESGTVPGNVIGAARAAAEQVGFFHWRLAFPDVFGVGDGGGFDAVLGNPPWERVKLTEKEFFEALDHVIADAPNKAARDRLIKRLPRDRPEIAQAFDDAKRTAENASLFMRLSERFPLTGRGDVNLYSVFTEQFRTMLAASGQCGIIVPTGIATDNTNKQLFSDLVFRRCLVAVYGFENEEMVFPGVHHAFKFALVTISGKTLSIPPVFVFFARQAQQIYDESRRFTLSPDDFALLNPNTRTCPIFRTARDAELTKAIYRAAPVLIDKSKGEEGNPWGVTFKTIFHMSNDSHLFHTREELERDGAHLDPDGYFRRAGDQWLPLYESKMIHQFDHRFGTYEGQTEAQARQGKLPELTELDHRTLTEWPCPVHG